METEERKAAAAETDMRISDVLKRLQKLETKDIKSDEGGDVGPCQLGGWRPLFMVLGFEPNQTREEPGLHRPFRRRGAALLRAACAPEVQHHHENQGERGASRPCRLVREEDLGEARRRRGVGLAGAQRLGVHGRGDRHHHRQHERGDEESRGLATVTMGGGRRHAGLGDIGHHDVERRGGDAAVAASRTGLPAGTCARWRLV